MSVDLEAIAQRGRCEVSSLRLALPLLEQGYTPPFLARYRRDELGELDESSLWALSSALQSERQVASRRDELHEAWERTSLRDPAIGHAIKKSNLLRMLARLGRRLKAETSDNVSDATRLAVRVLNPQKGDGNDLAAIAAKVEGITDAAAAVADLDDALAKRLAGDPRIIAAAVRWLVKNARIQIVSINDPHLSAGNDQPEDGQATTGKQKAAADSSATPETATPETATPETATPDEAAADVTPQTDAASEVGNVVSDSSDATVSDTAVSVATLTGATAAEALAAGDTAIASEKPSPTDAGAATALPSEPTNASLPAPGGDVATNDVTTGDVATKDVTENANAPTTAGPAKPGKPAKSAKSAKSAPQGSKKQKKISPRQRRRRWLVSVLKPLAGKRFSSDKLSSFQVVMLGRALRSQVAECSFEYDATKLVAELQRTAGSLNRQQDEKLREIVLKHEAAIREAAESAWWDDLQERASARLVTITADHLRRQVNRGSVEAKVVMSIDAIGPRTAATSIVSSDGRLLHCEDLACQLSSSLRAQAVTKMGELIHTYHVDLIVISNGPARRALMIALGDLISQSPEKSVRWTLADRSGADAYASSGVADQEMRSTPRRFRAAAWLAFSVLQPAQALAKVDPLKLRLSSFQRELSDEALSRTLEDVMVSGASRGGVDINSAPASWLSRLPGMSKKVAEAIDVARRESLFESREAVSSLEQWESTTQSRQAVPFLRVFGSQEVLDGTLVHPEDYALAKKLAAALEIELPPDAPPGYVTPDFTAHEPAAEADQLSEAQPKSETKIDVEDFSSAGEKAHEFAVDAVTDSGPEAESQTTGEEVPQAEAAEPVAATEPESASDASSTGEVIEQEASGETEEPALAENSLEPNDSAAGESGDAAATAETGSSEEPESAPVNEAEPSTTSPVADMPEPIKRPLPEKARIEKCIKEWQIGSRRAHQLVHWLCDPFGDSDATGNPPAVLHNMPSSKSLKQGDKVIGVVVGVMPFGVFVELAPDCSGLIHVSRISDSYVEDLHEAIQVGDVVTAWVTGIDEKRKRVALSAVSPQREAELEAAKHSRHERPHGGPPRGGPPRGRSDRPQTQGASRGTDTRGAKPAGQRGARGGDQGRGKDQRRGGRPRDASRDNRGRGREKRPESYRVVSKTEAKPITDAMQKGEEPLRSFGDLMQFFGSADKPDKSVAEKSPTQTAEAVSSGNEDAAATVDKAESNAGNAELNVDQQAADPVGPHPAEPPKADETKPNNDQVDTDPPTESSSPADASTS